MAGNNPNRRQASYATKSFLDFIRPQSRGLGTAALIFLWLLSLYQDKESNWGLGQRHIYNNKPTHATSREGI